MKKGKGKIPSGKNQAAVELGHLGGVARAKKLTPERRREIAVEAIKARWNPGIIDEMEEKWRW